MGIKKISSPEFQDLSEHLRSYIDDDKTGSIVGLVYHKDKIIYCEKFGWKDKEKEIPIELNSIFRIYSMTKPIICVAAIIAFEENKVELDHSISKYLPEFSDMKVIKSFDKETGEFEYEESNRQITIRDLFMHTSGLSYGFIPNVPIDILYAKEFGFNHENLPKSVLEKMPTFGTLTDLSKKLATLPLAFHPGTHWWYGFNHDILGHLIETISGKSLDVFLKER
ncbi:MAG: serine hydrolase domain-containing protein [Candidatus Kariarchaeaceae archaeon]|jgi:CubicO group peptidase (beta-lactamase class C family)